ncbi:Competence protein [hydrothermal vent metagenome]|uniref:Competence protein n=1 Tax=hydrothermal vent metagenome TaxID=652676 RepID=A0A1W1BJT9_9ZZZZ
MQALERVELLKRKRDFFALFALFFTLLSLSLGYEYYNYHQLTKFDSQIVHAKVLKQYTKTKTTKKGKIKSYQVLKLKSDDGFTFYTIASKKVPNYKGKNVELEVWAGKITFWQYLKGFFAFSKIANISKKEGLESKIIAFINAQHKSKKIQQLYDALFLAKPLPYALQKIFSNLGISHLVAISGFHLGVLSALLFFLIKYPYKYLQSNYFPYRSATRDTFFIIALILFAYMIFIATPPSLLRAFVMLVVGFYLYDRGIKIISMQTLLLSVLLIIALFPRLIFSIGLFLSLSGTFYILLFLIHFQDKSKLWQFLLLPFWVYVMMLPYSLAIFGNFSLYHPLSILLTSLFMLFYPLSIFLHVVGFGGLFDAPLLTLMDFNPHAATVALPMGFLYIEILLSFLAIFKKQALLLLIFYTLSIFIYAIYYIA